MSDQKNDNSNNGSGTSRQYAARQNTGAGYTNTLMNKDLSQKQSQEDIAVIKYAQEQEAARQANALDQNSQANIPYIPALSSVCPSPNPDKKELIKPLAEEGSANGAHIAKIVGEETAKAAEKGNNTLKINSSVGECEATEGKPVNLGADVAIVQGHLKRLNILSEEDYETEKVTTTGVVDKADISKTLEAIWRFQKDVLGWVGDGYATPEGKTFENLKSLTPEEAAEKAAAAEEAKQKAIAAEKAKKAAQQKELQELLKTLPKVPVDNREFKFEEIKEETPAEKRLRIAEIKEKPATERNAQKILEQYYEGSSEEKFGEVLKDYVVHNPKLALRIYELLDYSDTDYATQALMKHITDAELEALDPDIHQKLYDTLDYGRTTNEEEKLMDRLNKAEKNKSKKAAEAEKAAKAKEVKLDIKLPEEILKEMAKIPQNRTEYKFEADDDEEQIARRIIKRTKGDEQLLGQVISHEAFERPGVVEYIYDQVSDNIRDDITMVALEIMDIEGILKLSHDINLLFYESLESGYTRKGEEEQMYWLEKLRNDKMTVENKIELLLAKDRLSPEEIAKVRPLIASLEESKRAEYYMELQGKVKYENQRDSAVKDKGKRVEGKYGGICNLTSLSMVLQYLGISNPYPDMQYEDALEKVRQDNKFGSRTTAGGWGAVARKLGAEVEFLLGNSAAKNKAWWNSKVKSRMEEGYGIMMSIQGHIVRLQDINENGLVVDDPYGKIDLQKRYDNEFKGGYIRTNKSEWNSNVGNKNNEGDDNLWNWEVVEKYPMKWIASFKE